MDSFLVEVIGWVSTLLVLLGFAVNAQSKRTLAFVLWIVGDVGWITYDIFINNYSHLTLSLFIIILNVVGILKDRKKNGNT